DIGLGRSRSSSSGTVRLASKSMSGELGLALSVDTTERAPSPSKVAVTTVMSPLLTSQKSGSLSSFRENTTASPLAIPESALDPKTCLVCKKDEYSKRDQLIPCTSCHRNYHTHCTGNRRIPFNMKTKSERDSRDKYIAKYY